MKISISNNKILNRKDVTKGGQLRTTGQIELKTDTEMFNAANHGKDHREKMAMPLSIIVPKGTIVDYEMQETRSGFYHTVSFKKGNQRFDKTKSTPTVGGRKPS